MPQTPHLERHFTASETVRDIVIGMSDGLTVPFALAAGLTASEVATSNVVVTAGLAEVAAGAIAMGLGGFLAARTDAEHYAAERRREMDETVKMPERERQEVAEIFRGYGLADAEIEPILAALCRQPDRWVDFMMRFELGLEQPNPRRAGLSAATIGGSYIVGGMIPLAPYFVIQTLSRALLASTAVTLVALFVFGYFKGRLVGLSPWRGALQTTLIGGLAAGVAFALAQIIS